MSFASRGKAFFSRTAAAARNSAENVAAAAKSTAGVAPSAAQAMWDAAGLTAGPESMAADGDALRGRMAYIAVSRSAELLAEVADREVPEVEKDFAIALGRKMIKRTAPPGWDEISSGRHRGVKFTIHDLQGCTSYIICFSHTFPADRAQAFVQKLALMLDPVIEKSSTITEGLIESTILIVLPVLERELERGNSGVKSYQIDNQKHEVKAIIVQNVEIMLDRDEKLSEGSTMEATFKKKTRTLKRFHLTQQVKWGVGPGTKVLHASAELDEEIGGSSASDAPAESVRTPSQTKIPAAAPQAKTPAEPSKSAGAATPKEPRKAAPPKAAKVPEPPPKPQTPRTRARTLVGNKLSEDQVAKAAELIMKLEPYVQGRRASLDDIWSFFEVAKPPTGTFREGDATAKSFRGKMNRQRLLLHPDKNMHPEAEKTFKFLEQCNQRLTESCMRRECGYNESTAQRTRREEEELGKEEERAKKQEEEWQARQEKIRQEEDDKFRQEEKKVHKAEIDRQRYEKMLRDKENMRQNHAERVAHHRKITQGESQKLNGNIDEDLDESPPDERPCALPTSQPGLPASSPPSHEPMPDIQQPDPKQLVGKLSLTVLGARDLPPGGLFTETNAYAMAGVGMQRVRTASVAGVNPTWNCTFEFDVHMEDQGLYVTVWREGWGFSLLGDDFLGRVELPFLDLDDWSGCAIGRVIEGADPEAECMVLELKASIEWL